MPAFPDRESSLLNKLYETAPWTAKLHQQESGAESGGVADNTTEPQPAAPLTNGVTEPIVNIGLPVQSQAATSKLRHMICACTYAHENCTCEIY